MKQDINYIVGVPIYDEDNQLWEVKVGKNDKKMTLLYSVWGKTEEDSYQKAKDIVAKHQNNFTH